MYVVVSVTVGFVTVTGVGVVDVADSAVLQRVNERVCKYAAVSHSPVVTDTGMEIVVALPFSVSGKVTAEVLTRNKVFPVVVCG